MSGEHNGVKYAPAGEGKWSVRWPSGVKSIVSAADEATLKKLIDEAKAG